MLEGADSIVRGWFAEQVRYSELNYNYYCGLLFTPTRVGVSYYIILLLSAAVSVCACGHHRQCWTAITKLKFIVVYGL